MLFVVFFSKIMCKNKLFFKRQRERGYVYWWPYGLPQVVYYNMIGIYFLHFFFFIVGFYFGF